MTTVEIKEERSVQDQLNDSIRDQLVLEKEIRREKELQLQVAKEDGDLRLKKSAEEQFALDMAKANEAALQKQLALTLKLLAASDGRTKEGIKLKEQWHELNNKLKDAKKTLDELAETEKEISDVTRGISAQFETMGGQLGLMGSNANNITRSMAAARKEGKGLVETFGNVVKGIATALHDMFRLENVLVNVVATSVEAMKNVGKARTAMIQSGMGVAEAEHALEGFDRGLRASGVMAADYTKVLEELHSGFSGLSLALPHDEIVNFGNKFALLEKAGLDTQDALEFVNYEIMNLNKTPKQAMKSLSKMAAVAKKLHVPLNVLNKDWLVAEDRMSVFGKDGVKIFAKLAAMGHKAGVEMDKLLGIAAGFDTFEDAFENVGNLNALLGGPYLDSIEMANASDEERVRLTKEAIKQSGFLEKAGAAGKRALAGMVPGNLKFAEIQRLVNSGTVDVTAALGDEGKALQTMKKDAEGNASGVEKLSNRINSFLASLEKTFTPIMNSIADMDDWTLIIGGVVGVLGSLAFTIVTTILPAIASLSFGAAAAGKTIEKTGKSAGKGIASFMKSLESAAGAAPKAGLVLGILTVVIMGLAAAFNLAARGVASIIQSMSGVGLEKLKVFGATVLDVMMALNPIGQIFLGIEKVINAIGNAIEKAAGSTAILASSVGQVIESAEGMTLGGLAGFTLFANELDNVIDSINDAELDKLEGFRKTLQVIYDPGAATDNMGMLTQTDAQRTGAGRQNINVRVVLDSAEFKHAVLSVVNNEIRTGA